MCVCVCVCSVQAKPRGWKIANRLVFKKVQRLLGFERCRLFLTGSAPVHLEVLEFFMSLDIPLLEVYGLTETTTPYTLNLLSQWRVGSVGRPMAGTQAKVLGQPDEGGEGEVCVCVCVCVCWEGVSSARMHKSFLF